MIRKDTNKGCFGEFGGKYIPEVLAAAIQQLEDEYEKAKQDPTFWAEIEDYLKHYVGRPSPLYFAERLTQKLGGAKIYLKREDLNHTGAHKINNVVGQAMLTKRMGKKRIISETGAGQHGVATATFAAVLGLECVIYMGAEDCRRQKLNVYRMKLLGAECVPVHNGQKTLADAVDACLGDWLESVDHTHYLLGSAVGPHPFPTIVRDFQSIVGRELKTQILEQEGRLPDVIMACCGGGSNAAGAFYEFIDNDEVKLIGVEAGGEGIDTDRHAATLTLGSPGVIHGMRTLVLQDDEGNPLPVHSISAGLDYPGIGPEHAHWKTVGRVEYHSATDLEALAAFEVLSQTEGIIPALESSHAVADAIKLAPTMDRDKVIVINLSGRGDKDCAEVARLTGYDV